jgi:DNA topoisomerase I
MRYTTDAMPGITRASRDRFIGAGGRPVRDRAVLERIRALVIPPKWTKVWICADPQGHLQATGRDARGRKQYIYHPQYRAAREELKYSRMAMFGKLLPRIRGRVRHDLSTPGIGREKVLAAVVALMDLARVRVGNEEYARANGSFGITTLRDRHVQVHGSTIRFRFRGKSGKDHDIELQDRRLAAVVKRCRDLPGYELFRYVEEDGSCVSIDSTMVNDYLREASGEEITAKDFRTWHGTVEAAVFLGACTGETEREVKQNVVAAVKHVAERLGNRPATCRKHYVHPMVIERYTKGELGEKMTARNVRPSMTGLSAAEKCVLSMLTAKARARAA